MAIKVNDRPAALFEFDQRLGLGSKRANELRKAVRLHVAAFEEVATASALKEEIARRSFSQPSSSGPELHRYYRRHVAEFGKPERRTFNFLIAATKQDAISGILARKGGDDWGRVTKKYSLPQVVAELGWRLVRFTQAEVVRAAGETAARAAFATRKYKKPIGPIPLEGGWLVFEVDSAFPGYRPGFHLARDAILNRLADARRRSALQSIDNRLKTKYSKVTQCAREFDLPICASFPRQ